MFVSVECSVDSEHPLQWYESLFYVEWASAESLFLLYLCPHLLFKRISSLLFFSLLSDNFNFILLSSEVMLIRSFNSFVLFMSAPSLHLFLFLHEATLDFTTSLMVSVPFLRYHLWPQLKFLLVCPQQVIKLRSIRKETYRILVSDIDHLLILSSYFFVLFSDIVAPTAQPSSFPSGFTSMIPYSWSTVPYLGDVILSAAWLNSSTVVAVGRAGDRGLFLMSTTGGSFWTAFTVSMTDSIVHYSLIYI